MPKEIISGDEVKEKILAGVNQLADPVIATLGAKGGNTSIDTQFEIVTVNDGATIAGSIELPDVFENMGAKMLRTSALKANDEGGDGTTTATLLGRTLIKLGFDAIDEGSNAMILRKELAKASKKVVDLIKDKSIKIKIGTKAVQDIATVSCQDEVLGELIAKAYKKIGVDGIVTVAEANGLEHELDYTDGLDVKAGFLSPWFITDIERMVTKIEKPYILVTDHKIGNLRDILPALKELKTVSNNIVIFTGDVSPQALGVMVENRKDGIFNILVVKVPGFGSNRRDTLMDIAALTGANIISEEEGRGITSTTLADFGRADSIMATKSLTTIVGGGGDKELIKKRVVQIKTLAKKTKDAESKDNFRKRAASLSGGIAILRVSAMNETEMRDRKLRVDDAVNATKAALKEGILPGGGTALFRLAAELDESVVAEKMIATAMMQPIFRILKNAGHTEDKIEEIMNAVDANGNFNYGYNVETEKFGEMIKEGIVDPTKVEVSALRNAISVAGSAITTKFLIAEKPVDNSNK